MNETIGTIDYVRLDEKLCSGARTIIQWLP